MHSLEMVRVYSRQPLVVILLPSAGVHPRAAFDLEFLNQIKWMVKEHSRTRQPMETLKPLPKTKQKTKIKHTRFFRSPIENCS